MSESYSETVKEYGRSAGAGVVGIAASKDFGLAPDGFKPADVLEGCVSVIVLGSPFPQEALTMEPPEYTALRNDKLTEMTDIAKKVAKRIKADGYLSKAISASGGITIEVGGRKELFGHISLKHAAEIAGLGVISKNYLLTSPQYGNLLWLSAVLTDAPLTPDGKLQSSMCEGCNICVDACPVGALGDTSSFGKAGCSQHFKIKDRKLLIECYKCRAVCPHRFGIIGE